MQEEVVVNMCVEGLGERRLSTQIPSIQLWVLKILPDLAQISRIPAPRTNDF